MQNQSIRAIAHHYCLLIAYSIAVPTIAHAQQESTDKQQSRPPWQFAHNYRRDELEAPNVANQFMREYAYWAGRFRQPGIGINKASGLTYDGYELVGDGSSSGRPRDWSAASKESLDIALCAAAIEQNPLAQLFIYASVAKESQPITALNDSQAELAVAEAVDHLTNKIASYERFAREYPGFAGYLPWFRTTDEGLRPLDHWSDAAPSLDNGQLAWSLFYAYHVLAENGQLNLSERFKRHFQELSRHAAMLFLEDDGAVRAEVQIVDVHTRPHARNYAARGNARLEDPYEGLLMRCFLSMFGGLESSRHEELWNNDRFLQNFELIRYPTDDEFSLLRGHWFSSHEQWHYLVLPFTAVHTNRVDMRHLYIQGEQARTWYAAQHGIPGLFASTHDALATPAYVSDAGIPALASQKVSRQDIVAPYAAFPVIFASAIDEDSSNSGLKFLDVMLDGPDVQTPYGPVDSVRTDGSSAARIVTWDGAILPLFAMIGGIGHRIGWMIEEDDRRNGTTLNATFQQAVDMSFGTLNFHPAAPRRFAAPTASIPESP